MSTLWTPEGEHPVGRESEERARPDQAASTARAPRSEAPQAEDEDLSPQERQAMAQQVDELRRQLVSTPVEVVVANHAYGLFELAAIHLSEHPPRLEDARLAIDAMASLVESLEGRLGEPERSLRDALAQVRLAYVQIGGSPAAADGEASEPGAGSG